MSGRGPRGDFTENLEAVARGVRRLEEIRDPILREAVSAALRLQDREHRLDPASRSRMRHTVLAALAPAKPTLADRLYGVFALIGKPAPMLVRALVVGVVAVGMLGGATVASADSLPDDPLYAVKLAGEQLRLAIAVNPADRAAVELSIAEHRLDEAERLAAIGREDDAIIATASYGSSLADAAADLASVESSDSGTAALVAQLQTSLITSQQRVAATAARLAADPRTVTTAQILGTVAATAAPSKDSPAAKIANAAAAITARLAVVADDRARLADQRRTGARRGTATPRADLPTAAAAVPTSSATLRPPVSAATPSTEAVSLATPRQATNSTAGPAGLTTPSTPAEPSHAATPEPSSHAVQTALPNASSARQAAQKAKEAAQRALEAAAKAKRGASHNSSAPRR